MRHSEGASQLEWEARCFLWPCICLCHIPAFPATFGLIEVGRRDLVAASVFGKVEGEGSQLVKAEPHPQARAHGREGPVATLR